MARIKFVGFDMDATLAIYKTPQADKLAFETVNGTKTSENTTHIHEIH